MTAAEIKRLRELEEKNAKLKRMYVDVSLEVRALKNLIEKAVGDALAARGGRVFERGALVKRAADVRGGEIVETGVSICAAGGRRHGTDRGIEPPGEGACGPVLHCTDTPIRTVNNSGWVTGERLR